MFFILFKVNIMKVLVFDTETSGLPVGRNPSILETEKWPHMVQLSYIVYDTTENKLIHCKDDIIKIPKHVNISEESVSLHVINHDISNVKGIKVKTAINEFNTYLNECELVIGHNISFDKRIIMVESIRQHMRQHFTTAGVRKPEYCTMKNSVDICKIEAVSKKGEKYFKYPNLSELYKKLFDDTHKNVHNSLIDVILCLRCYCKMANNVDIKKSGCQDTQTLFNLLK